MHTIYTIGHSTRDIADFTAILHTFDIQLLADIRSMPGSGRHPQFNRFALEISLKEAGLAYIHLPQLGGRGVAGTGYPKYMETDIFKMDIKQLLTAAVDQRTAYMCAEALWSHCHRAHISDFLIIGGWQVIHIINKEKSIVHSCLSPVRQGDLF